MAKHKLKSESVTVGTTAVALSSRVKPVLSCVVQATNAMFIGGSDVTTSNGFAIAAGASVNLASLAAFRGVHEWDLTKIYLVAASPAQNARVLYSEES